MVQNIHDDSRVVALPAAKFACLSPGFKKYASRISFSSSRAQAYEVPISSVLPTYRQMLRYLSVKEYPFYKYFLFKYKKDIQAKKYSKENLSKPFQEIIDQLEKPVALIDVGTSKFKVLVVQPKEDIVALKITMPNLQLNSGKGEYERKRPYLGSISLSKIFKGFGLKGSYLDQKVGHLKIPQLIFPAFEMRADFSNALYRLEDMILFTDQYLRSVGVQEGLYSETNVLSVATESFRQLLRTTKDSSVHPPIEALVNRMGVETLSPEQEARLIHRVLTAGLNEEIVQQSLAVDVGGGSVDCAYFPDSHQEEVSLPGQDLVTQGFTMGHRVLKERDVNPFDVKSLMSLEGHYRKIVKETLLKEPLSGQPASLIVDLNDIILDYVKKLDPDRNLMPDDDLAPVRPISREELKKDFLNQGALDAYRESSKRHSGDYGEKEPVRLLIFYILMDELGIEGLYQGRSGGMKLGLLEKWKNDGRQVQGERMGELSRLRLFAWPLTKFVFRKYHGQFKSVQDNDSKQPSE